MFNVDSAKQSMAKAMKVDDITNHSNLVFLSHGLLEHRDVE